MADETLKLLQHALRRPGSNPAPISPAAVELCKIIDHHVALWQFDRDRYDQRIKALESRVAELESKEQSA